jgi:prepilin-type processing-associated H-X9-DG protein
MRIPTAGRSDYAANCGDQTRDELFGGPGSIGQGDDPNFNWPSTADHTGICYQRSEVTMADIKDGASNTYLIGEKYINPDHYLTGGDSADNESMYVGYDNDMYRTTHPRYDGPRQDRRGWSSTMIFGSAHASGCQFVFCDGSVRNINFAIDRETHRCLGNRRDMQPVDATEL